MSALKSTAPREFIEQLEQILDLIKKRGIPLKLIGALAFNLHCPEFNYFHTKLGRVFTDLDFVGRYTDADAIRELFTSLGWEEDTMVTTLYGESRRIFNDPKSGLHADVFFDKLVFSHDLPLLERLEVDELTIPLAELFVEKAQIFHINEKDIIDILMLLREHPVGEIDQETVNAPVIARLCASDWGLWKTVTMNMYKARAKLINYEKLTEKDQEIISGGLDKIARYIEQEPKSMGWKLRSKIGERMKWHKDVDEV
ncbi:MAG TPA: hypothetical protein GX711_07090 [Clostridia bacterium]|nr:hypothetical protein [Clostridia bacterium]